MLIMKTPEIILLPEKKIEMPHLKQAPNGIILPNYVWDAETDAAGAAQAGSIQLATVFDLH